MPGGFFICGGYVRLTGDFDEDLKTLLGMFHMVRMSNEAHLAAFGKGVAPLLKEASEKAFMEYDDFRVRFVSRYRPADEF